ncbi:MAG: B12-binding domain-containing radical SAM protein [Candidatus Omnitrophica bacterium]|nr:B12-binding domain-containing radical SAM protein [Candidatus Omnitrophota bacterium]
MKITLIKPNMGLKKGQDYQDLGSMQPYALAILAGLIPSDVEVKLYDDRLDRIDYDEKTDLVAITVETFTAKRAYTIAGNFRKRAVPVVMGGFHASLIPNEVKEHADSVVIGEAEPVFGKVIDDLKRNALKPFYYSGFKCELLGYRPDRRIFRGKKYLPITLTHFSRGCPYSCSYCPDAVLYQGGIRFRPVEDVVDDIESQDKDLIFFVDNNITYNRTKLEKLLRAVRGLGIKWISQADINVAKDEKILKLMAKSGCIGLVIGFETLSEASLRQMQKFPNIPLLYRYDELVRRIHDYGISVWAAFLLGYDYDTKDTIEATLEFAIKHKFFFSAFNQLIPYHGTPIYSFLKAQQRLLFDRWWIDTDYKFGQTSFMPKNMSPEELTDGCLQARLRFNSYTNIFRRATNVNANFRNLHRIAMFLKYTYLFKKEIKNKQNMILR